VELLSGVMKAADLAAKPAEIGREPGSAFSLFGGYISGRQIELIPGKRVVQAWRTASWPEGIYSIARFELVDDGTGTNLIFDQAGFPAGEAEHLSSGWKANYWNAMSKFLSA
jgi:activator of HSP90 ATPase